MASPGTGLPTVSGRPGKRAFDVVAGTILAVLALPVIGVFAVMVCVDLRTRHPFFRQPRAGRGGKPFILPKLRTLPGTAPAAANKYLIATVPTTRLGRFLRNSHLDELPQLLLVPLGRMSLVGPRPEMPWLLESFDPAFVAARSQLRPGCTGLWQIGIGARKLIGESPEYDLCYMSHVNLRLDLWILWRSLLVMAGCKPLARAVLPRWTRRAQPHVAPRIGEELEVAVPMAG
ncbi:MAG: sugar transferase [Actinomycetota bacterium]|nr:sugar transferase [Actinomycetota bacterium]